MNKWMYEQIMNDRAQCGTVVGIYQKLSFSVYDR